MKPCFTFVCIFLCVCACPGHAHAYGNTPATSKSFCAGSLLLAKGKTSVRRSLKANRAWLNKHAGREVRQACADLNSTVGRSDLDGKLRGLTPHGATLLGPMGINRFDLMQGVLFGNMDKRSKMPAAAEESLAKTIFFPRLQRRGPRARDPADFYKPAAENAGALPQAPISCGVSSSRWDAWLGPVAAFERYDAKNEASENASAATKGMVGGTVRHYPDYSLGFTGFFMRSASDGGGWSADIETYGFMTGINKPAMDFGPFAPRLRLGVGYAYSQIKQKRNGILGFSHDSFPGQHGIRLAASMEQCIPLTAWMDVTPSAGLDYTHIRQDAYTESGRGVQLAVESASMQSLRPFVGGEITLRTLDSLTLSTKALVRHELADRTMVLDSEISGTPLQFTSRGYQYSRSSGSGSFQLFWQASDDVALGAQYHILMGDRYPGHYAHAPAAMSYDGESYDGSSGTGGLLFNWQLAKSVSLNATYDTVFDGDAPGSLMNAVITWEF